MNKDKDFLGTEARRKADVPACDSDDHRTAHQYAVQHY